MAVYKRGAVYWMEFVHKGRRYRQTTNSKDKRTAGQIEAAFYTSVIKGEVGLAPRRAVPNFTDAMDAFLAWSQLEHHDHPATAQRSITSSKALKRYFRARPLDQITAQDVEGFKLSRSAERGSRTGRKLRPATVNRELACLREMFNHALKDGHLLVNPVRKGGVRLLAEDNQQDRVLRFWEEEAYLAVATPALADVAGLILQTGMRPEEVYTLRGSAVDLENGTLRVLKGKTPAARRLLSLTAEARRILNRRVEEHGPAYLFPCESDPARPMPKVNNAHDRAVLASKVKRFRLYDLRHTWATRAAESGVDLVTLAAMMGHSRIQMVMRYAHPTREHQVTAMDRVEKHRAVAEKRERAALQAAKDRKERSNLVVLRSA